MAYMNMDTHVTFAYWGLNSSIKLGRCSVPAAFMAAHLGDSGRNGRMIISGMAGMIPEISV